MLYLNNGDGTFTDATTSDLGGGEDNTNAAAFADFNGDSFLDLVKATKLGGVMLYLGNSNGDGTFATGVMISADAAHRAGAVAEDFNGDGWLARHDFFLQMTFVD